MPVVHRIAQLGFGSGTNELYDRARPSYQSFVFSHIAEAHIAEGVKKSSLNVVEIGAGTGIFTRALLAHPDWAMAIRELKAVEPSAGMRRVFSETVTDERVSIQEGTFDTTGVETGWADFIFIAQAFHWCPDYNLASAEFARILKPDGALVCVWNLADRTRSPWVADLQALIEQHEKGTPQFRHGLWRQTFDTPLYRQFFQPPEEKVWPYVLPTTAEDVVERVCSASFISILPDDEKARVKEDVLAICRRREDKVWVNESEGIFEYPYETLVVIARKK
ncbi:S-adenosyl-L-methionine-dependent methyltransferase [Infundibulicybe gibba]|nr:S-adenosyl-L-methionine-dependent methyltransferase [Infundibulicybe gibba]